MESVDVYLLYCAIKAHFGEGDYNFHKFGGKSKVSRKSFYKRKDRLFFVKLANRLKEYDDIKDYLVDRIDFAISKGVDRKKIIIDPGIGFGKTVENNFEIINNLNHFVELNFPVLLGASRKSFIGISLNLPENDRLEGSLAANVIGLQQGVKIFRVHDVSETNKALLIANKIFNSNHLIS